MKTHSTIAGNHYTVTSPNGGTVTDASGKLNKVVASGDQLTVMAPSEALYCSDDDSDIRKANFKNARLALRMLGAGDNLLPSGYKRLEYLESTGEQYINLNKIPNDETGGKLKGCYLSMEVPHGEPSLLGSYGYINSKAVRFWVSMLSNDDQNGDRRMAVGWNTEESIGEVVHEGDIVESSLNYKNSRKYTTLKNGVAYEKMLSGSLQQSDSPLMFFAQKRGERIFCLTIGRIYNATISQGNVIESNYIPALDPTGAPCMFDTVSRTPFYNEGTGDFVTSPTGAATYGLRRVLPDWGKLMPNGLRRLYHVPVGYEGDIYEYALANGFKPIFEIECPTEGHWAPEWVENAEQIELVWKRTDPPADEL